MPRETGIYRPSTTHGETVKAFVPHSLPPADPALVIDGDLAERHAAAVAAIGPRTGDPPLECRFRW